MKKFLSLVLAILMVFCSLPLNVYANGYEVTKNINIQNISISSNEYLEFLESLEYTDLELVELYQTDVNVFNSAIVLPTKLAERTGIYSVTPKQETLDDIFIYRT